MPLTLYGAGLLTYAGNPFLCGGEPSIEAVAAFLWIVSPGFRLGDDGARTAFLVRLRELPVLVDLPACARKINDFVSEMYLDAPVGRAGGKSGSVITAPEAAYLHIFAKTYGWKRQEIIHEPLPVLHALLRRITLDNDPDAVFINRRSDKVRGDYQRSLQSGVAAIAG